MSVLTNANPRTPNLSNAQFQSAHPTQVNVLCGDNHVTVIPNGFDRSSLNYYCLGLGRETWSENFTPVPLP